jgi:O-antigen/teichoic acid export membrane protein
LEPPGRSAEGGAHGAAGRVVRNTTLRAVGELVGKFASLALLAVLAREEGPAGLGVLVFALAWCELATAPIEMGFDRYFLRRVAADRAEFQGGYFNVITLKLARAMPVVAVSWLLVWALGYDEDTRLAVFVLTGAFLLDSFSYTTFAAFNAVERGDLVGLTLMVQRLLSGAVGVTLVLIGFGVVAVTFAYLGAALIAFALAVGLLARHVERPRAVRPPGPRRELRRRSIPFAAQELLAVGIARLDAVLLSLLATQSVVGLYGAAYRLLEATLFIPTALQGAFAAMFTYLDDRSEPTIRTAFGRSIKLALALLTPCAVPLAVLPADILELFFGGDFRQAELALRLLAPTVVLLGIVLLAGSLIASRLDPRRLVVVFGVALVVNVAMNAALIPPLEEAGAALAMLVTEVTFAVLTLRISLKAVGGMDVTATLAAPVIGGAAMAAVLVLLAGTLPLALIAGGAAYLTAFALAEWRLARSDFDFMVEMLRSRLPSSLGARLPTQQQEGG